MIRKNYIIAVEGEYQVTNGIDFSIEIYPSWKNAADVLKADRACRRNAENAEEAGLCSPIERE